MRKFCVKSHFSFCLHSIENTKHTRSEISAQLSCLYYWIIDILCSLTTLTKVYSNSTARRRKEWNNWSTIWKKKIRKINFIKFPITSIHINGIRIRLVASCRHRSHIIHENSFESSHKEKQKENEMEELHMWFEWSGVDLPSKFSIRPDDWSAKWMKEIKFNTYW